MSTAQQRGWGNPDGVLNGLSYRLRYIRPFKHNGIDFPAGANRLVIPLMHAMLDDLHKSGYVLRSGWCWGYANRDIRGLPGVKSNHSWGLALDVNAPVNPMTSDGRVHTNLPPNAGRIAKKYGFLWGGDYTGYRKDPMHFEFIGTKAEARRRRLALHKDTTPTTPTQPSKPIISRVGPDEVNWISVKEGDPNVEQVQTIQALLKVHGYPRIETDGKFGPKTTQIVKHFQKDRGIKADGIVGEATYYALLRANIRP